MPFSEQVKLPGIGLNNLKSRHQAFVVRVDIDWRHANSTQREGESSMFCVRSKASTSF